MPATVLIVANDKEVTNHLATFFNKKEFSILTAHSGRQALAQAKARLPDAIVLDATSPRLSVKRLVRSLHRGSHPLMFLLAQNPNRIEGGSNGAVVLPRATTPKKLSQRVRTALDNRPPRELKVGVLTLNVERRRVARGNRAHKLTPKEFELLRVFMTHAGQIVSRKTLMQEIWHTDYLGDTRTLDVHMRWLREKIEDDPNAPRLLVTVRGEGYRLETK
ncbi:MAG: response regulator transcription factor [Chloroflexota bacterium]|nr:MAG: response regulator transcription factor [Chloroflexota bacterium]